MLHLICGHGEQVEGPHLDQGLVMEVLVVVFVVEAHLVVQLQLHS